MSLRGYLCSGVSHFINNCSYGTWDVDYSSENPT